ncbi:MAG: radical SAM protein [Victivallaceae bacterium]|jgi:radical SAM protein with 4Fe4S-binding SPASM domain
MKKVMPNIKTIHFPNKCLIDLTYRCNNDCRHCWLRLSPGSKERSEELSTTELLDIVNQSRKLGVGSFAISGGEPMLRNDFYEIFDYITSKARSYSINTNGTLITPKIAQLMKRKGTKMVALYGATAKVHDHITRNPGSYEAAMTGFRYLKEAGTGFIVQLIPMKDNYHEFPKMIELAQSLSRYCRVGVSWLYLSSCGAPEINEEIKSQRLSPKDVIELDKPDITYEEKRKKESAAENQHVQTDDCLFASCIENRRDFHVDPYGMMSFCNFIKDSELRYDLRKGTVEDCWDNFIPSLKDKARGGKEYLENCGSCELRNNCRWCPVYAYLEYGRYSAKIEYLCRVAEENKKYAEGWKKNHRRYYNIADITIQVDSDLPITDNTFHPKFRHFQTDGPGEDNINIRHHFELPDREGKNLGKELYRKAPWAIYRNNSSWIYTGISPAENDKSIHRVAVFNEDHTSVKIYNDAIRKDYYLKGGLGSLTMFPSDQILIANLLAERDGCYLHSCGINFEGKGLLFAGHSESGKSTMCTKFMGKAEILCDDRIIVRKRPEGYRIYGTWCHGDIPAVSGSSVSLKAILFLEKAKTNEIIPLKDKREISRRLLETIIKPFVTKGWWNKTLDILENIATEIPCYILKSDKSNEIVELLRDL